MNARVLANCSSDDIVTAIATLAAATDCGRTFESGCQNRYRRGIFGQRNPMAGSCDETIRTATALSIRSARIRFKQESEHRDLF